MFYDHDVNESRSAPRRPRCILKLSPVYVPLLCTASRHVRFGTICLD